MGLFEEGDQGTRELRGGVSGSGNEGPSRRGKVLGEMLGVWWMEGGMGWGLS